MCLNYKTEVDVAVMEVAYESTASTSLGYHELSQIKEILNGFLHNFVFLQILHQSQALIQVASGSDT